MDDSLAIELLEHAAALRALARLLVGESHAEDLVQDVTLQTLRQPPPVRTGMRAYLQTMLRRRASNLRRTEQRRRRREEAVVSTTVEMSPASLVEHQEVVRLVTDQLLALPTVYRDVLFRRFFHDATPSAIAIATGQPLATVKSRLQRGLGLLRERLEAQRGAAWRPMLAGAFQLGVDRLVPGPVGTGGMVVMGMAVKVVVALGLAVSAWLAWWPEVAPLPLAAGSTPVVSSVATAGERLGTAAAGAPDPALERSPVRAAGVVAAAVPARLRGRAVDETQRPLAGVQVRLVPRADPLELYRWWREHGELVLEPRQATTGDDGTFTFEVATAPLVRFGLELQRPDRLPIDGGDFQVAAGAEQDLGDLVLRQGNVVTGRVVDVSGRPQVGCEVLLECVDPLGEVTPQSWERGVAAADGAVAFDAPLPAGTYRIEVLARRNVRPASVQVVAGARAADFVWTVDDVVAPMTIAGRVVDDRGLPVAQAAVSVPGGRVLTIAGADGSFVLPRPEGSPDVVPLRASCRGHEDRDHDGDLVWGATGVLLELRRGVLVELAVVAADSGHPVEDFLLQWIDSDVANGKPALSEQHGHFAGGRIRCEGMPRGTWTLVVTPRDPRLEPARQPVLCSDDARVATVELAPRAVPHPCDTEVVVRVQTPDGAPVAGSVVTIAERLVRRWPLSWLEDVEVGRATTDHAGTARLRAPSGVPVRWEVTGESHLRWQRDEVELSRDGAVTAVVDRGGTIAGRVEPADFAARYRHSATPRTGPRVAPQLRCIALDGPAAVDLNGCALELGDDGAFRSERLAAGSWRIELEWVGRDAGGSSSESGPELGVVQVAAGQASSLVLDLSRFRSCELRTKVLWNGEPLRDADVDLVYIDRDSGAEVSHEVHTDGEGRLLGSVRPGRFCIDWRHVTPTFLVRSEQTVDVVPGESLSAPFTLRTGQLQLQLRRPDGGPARGVQPFLWDPQSPTPLSTDHRTDEHGRLEITLPLGHYQVQLGELGARGRTLGVVEVGSEKPATAEFQVGADDR